MVGEEIPCGRRAPHVVWVVRDATHTSIGKRAVGLQLKGFLVIPSFHSKKDTYFSTLLSS